MKALWVTRALRPPQKTVSHGETATSRRDSDATALRCGCAAAAESRLRGNVAKRFRRAGTKARAGATVRFTHSKCGSGGWPGPHFFLRLLVLGSFQHSAVRKVKPASSLVLSFAFSSPILPPAEFSTTRVANMTPKKIYFGNFFRSRYRTSTRRVRVVSASRWFTTLLKQNCENF